MNEHFESLMALGLEEARQSLREGNCGFGAVIAQGSEVIANAHDTEKTARDPTAHAELTAIRKAAERLGRDLSGCAIISTHEPCPMCATAIFWSGLRTIAYGFSIKEAMQQGRRRIDLTCQEIFERAGEPVTIIERLRHSECSVLYHEGVRRAIRQLRNADEQRLQSLSAELTQKRLDWFAAHQPELNRSGGAILDQAYAVFLRKLNLSTADAPMVSRTPTSIVVHSRNFCPTLEACKILGLDTRLICARLTERPMDALLKQIDPCLTFSRNYDCIRPQAEYCEEVIRLVG
jgi:tRNA(adenine34) deaminase